MVRNGNPVPMTTEVFKVANLWKSESVGVWKFWAVFTKLLSDQVICLPAWFEVYLQNHIVPQKVTINF